LVFGDGGNSHTWKRCRVAGVIYAGGSGVPPTMTVLLEDRRWQWATGQISGRYNVPAEYTNTVALVNVPGAPQGNQNYTQVPIPPGEEPVRPETAKNAATCASCA
jgi:hypothetical protein